MIRKRKEEKKKRWDVPSGPIVKTPRFHCRRLGFHPPAAEVGEHSPHAEWPTEKKEATMLVSAEKECSIKLPVPLGTPGLDRGPLSTVPHIRHRYQDTFCGGLNSTDHFTFQRFISKIFPSFS